MWGCIGPTAAVVGDVCLPNVGMMDKLQDTGCVMESREEILGNKYTEDFRNGHMSVCVCYNPEITNQLINNPKS